MAVVIRMKRMGRTNRPSYRISVADSRWPRDGRTLEALGHYNPLMPRKEQQISLDVERARFWVVKGARLSETVQSIFKRLGVFEGVRTEKPKRDRSGRKTATKSRAAREAASGAREQAKAARRTQRVAAKKAKAKEAAKPEEAKS